MPPKSLLDPRNDEQRARQVQVQNYGAIDTYNDQRFKDDIMDMALEGVALINNLPYMEYEEPAEGEEPVEKLTPTDVLDFLACEAVGIDDDTEMTPELMDDYNTVLSQTAHALGFLAGSGKGAEVAFESIQDNDDDQLSKTCSFIEEQLNHRGLDDEEVAIEYVLTAPVIYGESEGEEIAIEGIKKVIRAGKKVLKSTKKKLRGAALAMAKKMGRKLGKMKMTAGAKKKVKKSKKIGKKMGFYK